MSRFLHVSDLHLADGDDREYSLSVLDEVLKTASEEQVQYLLVCGDLFDSFEDARALRAEFRERIAAASPDYRILFIPGNHDVLRQGQGTLESLDFGNVTLCSETPCRVVTFDDVEFLCIPHQRSYEGYHEWDVPEKAKPCRVALAHALVSGIGIYAGSEADEEAPAGAVDPDVFQRLGVNYAALGHIHGARAANLGDTHARYPGSARVWRKGEAGPRHALLVETSPGLGVRELPLESAGQYRELALPLGFDASLERIESEAEGWGSHDWVYLRLSGTVEDENDVARLESSLRETYSGRVRRLDIDRSSVRPVPGIASQPLARKFLDLWAAGEPTAEAEPEAREVWSKARELGLKEIADAMEGRAC